MVERTQAILAERAKTALVLLEEHVGDQGDEAPHAVFSRRLLEALEPFEARPKLWLRVNCSCGRHVTRAMYHDGGIYLGREVRAKLPNGSTVIRPGSGPTANVEIAHYPPPSGFESEPAGADVWARRKLRCPDQSCGRTFTYSAIGILRVWLHAVIIGGGVLLLGQQLSEVTPGLKREANRGRLLVWSTKASKD